MTPGDLCWHGLVGQVGAIAAPQINAVVEAARVKGWNDALEMVAKDAETQIVPSSATAAWARSKKL